VERSHYRQRLARLLRVEERALFPDSAGHSGGGRSTKSAWAAPVVAEPPQHEAASGAPKHLVESFCMASLIVFPQMLYQVNRVLGECLDREDIVKSRPSLREASWPSLDLVQPFMLPNDLAHPEYRTIFENWCAALEQDEQEPVSYLGDMLDERLYTTVSEWLSKPLDTLSRGVIPPRKPVSDDTVITEAIQRMLALRHSRIAAYIQELTYIMQDSENSGDSLTAKEYAVTIQVLSAALHRLSQAQRANSFTRRPGSKSQSPHRASQGGWQ
jgi:hypothetical protein